MIVSNEYLTRLGSLITAHKRSLGQGNIFCTCLSFCSQGVCLIACWDTPPPRDQRQAFQAPPPSTVHAGRYGQQAIGTHPTGLHSCLKVYFLTFKYVCLGLNATVKAVIYCLTEELLLLLLFVCRDRLIDERYFNKIL